MENNFENAIKILKEAVKKADMTEEDIELLTQPNRIINVNFPVKLSDGTVKIFNGYRVQHNNALGPYKGGIRFHHEVDLGEVKSLAFWMAIKCATVNIPMGGGKGGITFNPKEYSEEDIALISKSFVRHIADFIGSDKDVPAPDVYTNPKIMDIMVKEYGKIKGEDIATFTGKPVQSGGLNMRMYSTSMGGAFILKKMMEEKNKLPEETTVAIQGMGNAGSNMAKILSDWGFKIIALSDSRGAVYNKEGIDIEAAISHKQETKQILNLENTENTTNEELLAMDVDILIPSALNCAITPLNVDKIKAKIIVELANGPICNLSEDEITKRDLIVVPDVLANAGGVVGSYFEWRNNKKNIKEDEPALVEELKQIMLEAYDNVKKTSQQHNTSLRDAAYILATKRILEAEKVRENI